MWFLPEGKSNAKACLLEYLVETVSGALLFVQACGAMFMVGLRDHCYLYSFIFITDVDIYYT